MAAVTENNLRLALELFPSLFFLAACFHISEQREGQRGAGHPCPCLHLLQAGSPPLGATGWSELICCPRSPLDTV